MRSKSWRNTKPIRKRKMQKTWYETPRQIAGLNANSQFQKVKTRVRMAKMCLRVTNFSCSLIVLSMLSATFTIFNTTKSLPPRSNLPAWLPSQKTWPQITLLCIACVSLAFSLGIFYAYWRGGHKRAEKAAIYYTVFSIAFFTFSIIMWAVGAAILNESKKNGNGKDMWGWVCKDGKRKDLFQQDVDYALICRLQVRSLLIRTEFDYADSCS